MPSRLDTPVLTVDVGLIHKVDTRNVENLFSMWTVFSKCADSLEQGRRLENLSWRLWNRETFCCAPGEANSTTPAISIAKRSSEGRYSYDVPALSKSIDSLADEEAIESDDESASTSAPVDISRPRIIRQDSATNRSRGQERHITPDDLEKMVITIKEQKDLEPLDITIPTCLAPLATTISNTNMNKRTSQPRAPAMRSAFVENLGSDDNSSPPSSSQVATSEHTVTSDSASAASEQSATSVVRGFSPSQASSSYRSIPMITGPTTSAPYTQRDIAAASPAPKSALATSSRNNAAKKQTMFALGGSSQSGDESVVDASSVEDREKQPLKKRPNMFTLGGSSAEDDSSVREHMKPKIHTRSSLSEEIHRPTVKQTSFLEEVATRSINHDSVLDDDVFETDEEDEIDESAIEEDDEDAWEDSPDDHVTMDDKKLLKPLNFQRVDSRPNLTSRRSMLTTMLHEGDRAAALAHTASKSTPALQRSRTSSPNGLSLATSPDAEALTMKPVARPSLGIPRSLAQPIITTTTNGVPHQPVLSPKTTRRNMLSQELTASVRRNLLWERSQKNATATAVLKRRHTAHENLQNLKQYPERSHMPAVEENPSSWNEYFSQGLGEYHAKGW